ncbi:hypothetical protein JCM10449v2_005804 [Rhodotorula kratochvilovae]
MSDQQQQHGGQGAPGFPAQYHASSTVAGAPPFSTAPLASTSAQGQAQAGAVQGDPYAAYYHQQQQAHMQQQQYGALPLAPHHYPPPPPARDPGPPPSSAGAGAGAAAGPPQGYSPALQHGALPPPPASASSHGQLTPAMGTASLPTGGSGTQASPHMPKARSAMACQLCRRQKMKCEGPEKAPCRRCRAAQVECVFEAPPAAPPRPRGGGVTEAWVEGRLGQVEHRLASLEDATANGHALVATNGAPPSVSPHTITDHERRLAALEAQLYQMQITMARQVHLPPQQPHPSMYPPAHGAVDYAAPQHAQQQHHQQAYGAYPAMYGQPSGLAGAAAPMPPQQQAPQGRFSSPSSALKHEPDRSSSAASGRTGAAASTADSHRGKRWKGDDVNPADGDFIARGLVTEEEAALCFESYHLTFASNGLDHLSDQAHLSFEETRRRSPFFLATVISIGARSLSRFDTFHATYREAIRLAHESFLPSATDEETKNPAVHLPSDSILPTFARAGVRTLDDANTNVILEFRLPILSLKALILLGLYHSMPELLVHAWVAGYRFIQPTATQEFADMTEEERNSPKGRRLVNHTRVGLVAWLWLSFYTYVRAHHGSVWPQIDLLRVQLDVLGSSGYAEHPTDGVIRTNFEGNAVMLRVYEKLGPGLRAVKPAVGEVFETVKEGLAELDAWNAKYFNMMETVTQWGDSADLKTIVPLHYFRQWILMYIFRDIPAAKLDAADPQIRKWARMAAESAIIILRWGVESRIWMPFSVVGNYVHNVNVPAALWLLSVLARMYPSLIDFSLVRPLLHRLSKQCAATISSEGATYREIIRARKTKHEVEALDRVAFELCEADACGPGAVGGGLGPGAGDGRTSRASARTSGAGAGAGAGPGAGSASTGSSAGDDAPGLFGHEVTASLNSLRLELNLWAKPLQGFEDDD